MAQRACTTQNAMSSATTFRYRQTESRMQVSLIGTRRVDGKVRHEHIASFGSVEDPPSVEDRMAFWQRLHERLAKQPPRWAAQAKLLGDVHSRVPMVTLDEMQALKLRNAEADELLGECTSKVTASGGIFGYVLAGLAREREARMKRIGFVLATGLLCGQALAADLPMPAPLPRAPAAYVPVAPFSWTGIYIGGNVGAAWNRGTVSDAAGNSFTLPSNNAVFTGGGQVGGNWQMGALVLGVEGQFDWLANQNNASAGLLVFNTVTGTTDTINVISKDRWLTTLTGRIGVAADHWLFYAKGGGAWVGNQSFTVNDLSTGASFTTSNGGWNTGWTVGGGIEWAFAGPWSAKIEYDYVRLSSNSFTVPATSTFLPNDVFTTANRNIQTVLFGVNYRFGGW